LTRIALKPTLNHEKLWITLYHIRYDSAFLRELSILADCWLA
jgi:hypothetical protein